MGINKICQSCGMPLIEKQDFGTNKNGSINKEYCTYCFRDGKFTNECSMEEMIEHNLNYLDDFNKTAKTSFDKKEAREEMFKVFPTLKRWNKSL